MVSDDLALSILDELKVMRERIDELERLLKEEMAAKDSQKGFSLAGLLETDPLLRSIVLDLTKMGSASLSDLSKKADADEETLRDRLKRLQEMGYVKETIEDGETRYLAVMAKKQPRKVPMNIWNALEGRIRKDA
jgi:hypothetical protein